MPLMSRTRPSRITTGAPTYLSMYCTRAELGGVSPRDPFRVSRLDQDTDSEEPPPTSVLSGWFIHGVA